MGMESPQRGQRRRHHDPHGEGHTRPAGRVGRQIPAAKGPSPALATESQLEQVSSAVNLRHAYKRVRANGGAPGVDEMPVEALQEWLAANQILLAASLRDGSYRPAPVRGVAIPSPVVGSANSGSPRSWIVLCNKPSSRCWSPGLIQPSRRPARGSGPSGMRIRRSAKPHTMSQGGMTSWWKWILSNSLLESTTIC
jgi:hypothetical protein